MFNLRHRLNLELFIGKMYAGWRLLVHENDQNELRRRSFGLKFGENTIGRSNNNDVMLPDISVGREHLSIIVLPTTIILWDYSINGSKVNEFTIHLRDEELYEGDIIEVGRYMFLLVKETIEEEIQLE